MIDFAPPDKGNSDWSHRNHQHMVHCLDRLYHDVRAVIAQSGDPASRTERGRPAMPGDEESAIETVAEVFRLSDFETDLLLLCAGVDFDTRYSGMFAEVQNDQLRGYPTFGFALAVLPQPHWSALSPESPLRRWGLIHVDAGYSLTRSPLRIDERILHYLAGINHLDTRLAELLTEVPLLRMPVPSQTKLAHQVVALWNNSGDIHPLVQFCGSSFESHRQVAATACAAMDWPIYAIRESSIPQTTTDFQQFLQILRREAMLNQLALLIDGHTAESSEPGSVRRDLLFRLIDDCLGPVMLTSPKRRSGWQRPSFSFDVAKASGTEQHAIWLGALRSRGLEEAVDVDQLVAQFDLDQSLIANAVRAIDIPNVEDTLPEGPVTPHHRVWEMCRVQARPRVDDLAQRIEGQSTWDDLVLPAAQKNVLRELAIQVRNRARVYDTWGFGSKNKRGLGVTALFAGGSGTGKTMACEVLARELQLDLYRIDLSSVISKYIGETEKNLRLVFDAAEAGGAILLFDEADALFGKRTEVKDSHDRHANVEVSYLLQRMEAYQGLAILTSNLKESLDKAFLRRLRFIVNFPFPDHTQRLDIWRRVFPAQAPLRGIQFERLAQLNVAGGNIRNIALAAAFLAAEGGGPITMGHLRLAAEREYSNLERVVSNSELEGWS